MRPKRHENNGRKRHPRHQRGSVEVDVESLLSLENRCNGCAKGEKCCCSSYEVCVTPTEMKRIIKVLPEAARFCPRLLSERGYDNVFEEEERGLLSIDTTEDGLCVFAYWSDHRVRCALHAAAANLGLPLEMVKPKVCILWPMHFSEGEEVLVMISDAFDFRCNRRKDPARNRTLSPGSVEAIELVYGEGCGVQVKLAAENGERRTLLTARR